MNLDLMYRILDQDEEFGPNNLLHVARGHGSLWYLILSLLEQEGATFGAASRDELARARTRHAHFEWLLRELSDRVSLSVMKGPEIARLYPPGMLRTFGDLDLVFPDQAALWRAAEWITANQPVEWTNLSVVGADHHLVVAMGWASTDPLIDNDYKVDLVTAAFLGDYRVVPIRAALPADRMVAALLSTAEERFQRPFKPRDVIDVAMLDAAGFPPAPGALATITEYHRAPEVAELLGYADDLVTLGPALRELLAALPPAVEAELARRAAVPAMEPGDDVTRRLAAGQVAYGFPLGDTDWRGGGYGSRLEAFPGGHVLRTPIGDWLLTGATVAQETYEAALRACGLPEPAPEPAR